jgi:hypothetical protein
MRRGGTREHASLRSVIPGLLNWEDVLYILKTGPAGGLRPPRAGNPAAAGPRAARFVVALFEARFVDAQRINDDALKSPRPRGPGASTAGEPL